MISRYESRRLAVSATLSGVGVATVLAVLKYITMIQTDSISIELNFVDSCMDILMSLTNCAATILSFRSYKRYSYGYDKITILAAMLQVAVLLGFAYTTTASALSKVDSGHTIHPHPLAILSLLISTALTVLLMRYQKRVIDKTGHLVVYVDRLHYSMDMITNISMLIYFAIIQCSDTTHTALVNNFDSGLTVFLAAYIVLCCTKVVYNIWRAMMDRRISKERELELVGLISAIPQIQDAHIRRSRFSGVREFCEIDLRLPHHITVAEITSITDQAHDLIAKGTNNNTDCVFTITCARS
jgi:ferrous-iron efflux pump FieF